MLTALAISSNCERMQQWGELCHIVGYTPEARSVEHAFQGRAPLDVHIVGDYSIQAAYEAVCDSGESGLDFVSLGCPHYDIDQVKKAADYLKGKTIHPNVHFTVWAVYPIKTMADENGYTQIIDDAGGSIDHRPLLDHTRSIWVVPAQK